MKLVYVSRGMDTIENIALPMMTTQQMSPIDAIAKIIKEQVVVNPNPQKKTQGKLLSQEEWDLYKEEKIDRVKREKDNLMNADK
jgi:dynein light intermediate chain 2